MLNPSNQIQPDQTALEQAIKRHFKQDRLPDFDNDFLTKIFDRLNYERELKVLKPKLWAAVGTFVCGLGILAFGLDVFWRAFAQAPVLHYLSLTFSDFNLIVANWQDYSLGVLESLPLGSLAILLSSLLGSILLVDFAGHRLLDFRKTLNTIHYGK
jgi:hypothetical protein